MKISIEEAKAVEKKSFKEYEAGKYNVKVVSAKEDTSKNGTPYLEVEFETMGESVFRVKNRFYNTEKARSILLNFLGAIGVYDKNSKLDMEFDAKDLLGSVLKVELIKGEQNENGRSYLELKAWSCEAYDDLF